MNAFAFARSKVSQGNLKVFNTKALNFLFPSPCLFRTEMRKPGPLGQSCLFWPVMSLEGGNWGKQEIIAYRHFYFIFFL